MVHFTVGTEDVVMEDKLADKLDKMCNRITKEHPALDACLENSGAEGSGKTNVSIIEAAYIKHKTHRPIALFFKTSSAIKYMQSHEKAIVILDEPSFESLSSDAVSTIGKDFLRLTSTMRVKRHFFIINFAKFWKFPEFLVVDRALGMVHMKDREMGRFVYIRKRMLERLWNDYKKFGKRNFGKLKAFGGGFSYKMEKIFDLLDIQVEDKPHSTYQDYCYQKDKAIGTIGVAKSKKDNRFEKENRQLKYFISQIPKNPENLRSNCFLAKHFKVSERAIQRWKYFDENYIDLDDSTKENEVLEGKEDVILNIPMEKVRENPKKVVEDEEDEDLDEF